MIPIIIYPSFVGLCCVFLLVMIITIIIEQLDIVVFGVFSLHKSQKNVLFTSSHTDHTPGKVCCYTTHKGCDN